MCFGHVWLSSESDRYTGANVVTERDSTQEPISIIAELFADSKCCGDDRATRMRLGERMAVVGFVRMREHAIDHRRFDRSAEHVGSSHRRNLFALVETSKLDRELSRR